MKVQKAVSVLATLSILSFAVACNSGDSKDRYSEGFAAGKEEGYKEGYGVGYDDGYIDGDEAGYARAEAYFKTADYNTGYADGRSSGLSEGYTTGYSAGYYDGDLDGYVTGYSAGYVDGDADGYLVGYSEGYDDGALDGYDEGYDIGSSAGWYVGYDIGYEDGRIAGYSEGWDDAYYLSVGPTPKLKGYADVLSAFHNDMIDYSQIKAPVKTKRGLVVNGKLLLSEVSMTNKDTLKRAAAVEQYLVVEMAKQVQGKFGLSADRSLKVAKAANHFRKFATKRALTPADANAYTRELVGVDLPTIHKAYESTMKGDTAELQVVLEKASEKNGVSPEKMGEIMASLFI